MSVSLEYNEDFQYILRAASLAYDEESTLLRAWRWYFASNPVKHDNVGDGLAEFIARELTETFDVGATKKEQLEEANRVMVSALHQVKDVHEALWSAHMAA